jgi:hypothetical protein
MYIGMYVCMYVLAFLHKFAPMYVSTNVLVKELRRRKSSFYSIWPHIDDAKEGRGIKKSRANLLICK